MLTKPRINRRAIKAAHVRQVQRARTIIEDAAARLIARQLRDAAHELRESGIPKASAIFRPRDWDHRLFGAIGPALGRVMAYGAMAERSRHRKLLRQKSTASDYLESLGIDPEDFDFETEMPQELIDAIEEALASNFQRPYWQNINGTTANRIEGVLRDGTTDGLSIRDMAKQLEDISEDYSRTRAIAIARTESSAVLNEGHALGVQNIEDETGLQLGLEWVSVLGATTRPEHADADGQTINSGELFTVGGEQCRFPGDPSLSASQRVNCLCTCISSVGETDDAE